ncbi:DUF2513 domain-containing protein [uncultured Anaerococcus sp.]|uniref:DUF2513 domain-containing protein n=1 Tax=uncultured Anaerococcus sp. TaxID=293428 RepID=UPI0026051561|nr:DUF2513 domain-containing protein [uncultured Anaerococcus sp.]
MKLNYDAIRYLLIFLEDNQGYNQPIFIEDIPNKSFDVEDIRYSAEKLIEAEILLGSVSHYVDGDTAILINSISWEGHQFLAQIKNDNNRERIKENLKKLGIQSIKSITQIATMLTTEYIKNQLKI